MNTIETIGRNGFFPRHEAEVRLAPEPAIAGPEQLPLLTQYLRVLLRWKWAILGTVAATLLIGMVVTLLMTPLYTAVTTIEISRDADRVTKIEGVERETGSADLEFYQTQYGLLQARSLAEAVARDLKLADNARFLDLYGIGDSSGAVPGVPRSRVPAAERDERISEVAEVLLDNVTISPVRASRLVNIGFTSPDKEFAALIANAWARNFIGTSLQRRLDATSYARKFLEERLEQLRQKLEQSERALVAYAAQQKIINVPQSIASGPGQTGVVMERSLVAEDLVTLNQELAAATADRVRAEARVKRSGVAPEALANNAVNALRERRGEASAEYAKLMAQFQPDYPPAQALASEIQQLDRAIAREEGRVGTSLRGVYQSALEREQVLKGRVAELKQSLLDLRRRSIQYNIYQRDVDTNRELYNGLLQRYKEIGIAGGIGNNNVSIVDQAEMPEKPSKPDLALNLFLSLVIGLGLGVALAVALEQIDEGISDPNDVARLLGLPLLGAIPKADVEDPMEALRDRKSPMVEAYLSVQTNLEFATAHGAPRSIAVTSTRPAEGKSTTAFALAQSLARVKRKVVLVDGDMRSPSVHLLIDAPNDSGVSNFLSGKGDIDQLVHRVAGSELAYVTAGPQPPNAAELLTGDRLDALIVALLERFDHVVVDSPPVMGLADAPLIASKVEGTVFALESHKVRASVVRVAINRLASANAHLLGIVLTKFEAKRAHFGYGYEYGYGYGHRDGDAAAA
jgi:capsular exopolysaccharide synthesis family protein